VMRVSSYPTVKQTVGIIGKQGNGTTMQQVVLLRYTCVVLELMVGNLVSNIVHVPC